MKFRTLMLASAGTMTLVVGTAATAAPKHHAHKAAGSSANSQMMEEIRALRAQVEALQAKVEGQATLTTQTASQVEAQQAQITATQTKVDTTTTQVATQTADISKRMDKAEHPSTINFKGITITPGGFLEMAGIYRQHFQGNDISSSFAVPFPNNRASHVAEGRFTARQSRLSFLAQGKPNKTTTLSMYGEFDFQGGAQTANSNQSNSYNPRIRNLYGTIDWDRGTYGLHVLAGQNWSLVTMQGKGMSPRSEVTPPQIDAQYVPGFAWARQPGVRVSGDFMDHKLWLGVSAENEATVNPAGSIPTNVTYNAPAGSGFDSANNLSLNHVPDFIGKVAYEDTIMGHTLHVEGFGIYRSFDAHLNGASNVSAHAFGYGGSIALNIVPKVLDVQFSGMGGRGIGRYGSAGLPDISFSGDGRIHPIDEFMLLAGGTLHATPKLDIYAFAGEEQEYRKLLGTVGTTAYGVGLPTTSNAACFTEGGACGQNTRRIRQLTGGVWDKFYQGSFGRAQIGLQVSYTERQLFEGTGYSGYPQVHNTMGFVSFRYYPF